MKVFELMSQRLKRQESTGQPDVYQYDILPTTFRVQIVHILRDARMKHLWEHIKNQLCKELGVFYIGSAGVYEDPETQCEDYFLNTPEKQALDFIDFAFHVLKNQGSDYYADEAIKELNYRFKQNSIGYEFAGNELIRINSKYLHSEVVKPAILLLNEAGFEGASAEFLSAHKHYREGTYKEAIADALKAFESTLKTICSKKKWSYAPTDPAKKLIDTIFENKLLPDYLLSHFTALRSSLESGLLTLRNRTSGHGQGEGVVELPEYFAAYALHLAATNIVFLVRAYEQKK